MAQNDNALELELQLNFSEYERELAKVDSKTQQVMRKMQKELSGDKLKFDIEISGAKASGDTVRVYQLELQKLNHVYKSQEAVVNGLKSRLDALNSAEERNEELIKNVNSLLDKETLKLNKSIIAVKNKEQSYKAYEQAVKSAVEAENKESSSLSSENKDLKFQVDIKTAKNAGDTVRAYKLELERLNGIYKEQQARAKSLSAEIVRQAQATGKDSVEVKRLKNEFLKTKNAMAETQGQIKNLNAGVFKRVVSGLAEISPAFSKAIDSVSVFKRELSSLSSLSTASLAGLGAGAGLLAGKVVYDGLTRVSTAIHDTAIASAEASDAVFQLAERFELSYDDAEKLSGIFSIDGTNAEAFAKQLQKLNKELASGGEGDNVKMLEHYNVALRNADGTQKSYIQQTKALADAYQEAKKAGEGLDFLTQTLGAGGSQFAHLLNGFDDYLAKYEKANEVLQINYDLNHALLDAEKAKATAQQRLEMVQAQPLAKATLAGIEEETALIKQRQILVNEANKELADYEKNLAVVTTAQARLSQGLGAMLDEAKVKAAEAGAWLAKKLDRSGTVEENASQNLQIAEQKTEEERQKRLTLEQQKKQQDFAKKKADSDKKIAEAYAKVSRDLDDIGASDYEKQLNRLRDEVEANKKAGVDELTAWDVYYAKKAELDKKTSEEAQKRMEAETKKVEEEIQKRKQAEEAVSQVFMTETEKRISAIKKQRDEWIKAGADELRVTQATQKQINDLKLSEAQRLVRDQAELARYIDNLQKKGDADWRQKAEDYAKRQELKSLGVTERDVEAVARIGEKTLTDISQRGKERALAPVTANITVNFDNAILGDPTNQQREADIVSARILEGLNSYLGNIGFSFNS